MNRYLLLAGVLLCVLHPVVADDQPPQGDQPADNPTTASQQAEPQPEAQQAAAQQEQEQQPRRAAAVEEQARKVLRPLFSAIAGADVSRVTVQLKAVSSLAGEVLSEQSSTYQIASQSPDRFTIYYKDPGQRTRIYGDDKSLTMVMSPKAYVKLDQPLSIQDAVTSLPVPLGPYPEPILALSLAGVDPAISLFGGMKSVELVGEEQFNEKVPAIHTRGTQNDGVVWDLWTTDDELPEPLRLRIDLTPMLRASDQVAVPENFVYQLEMDFTGWRIEGEVDGGLFVHRPSDEMVAFDSLEEYYRSVAGVAEEHPLLGQPAPEFTADRLTGGKLASSELADKVVILDFWATWCEPCLAAIPVIEEVAGKFKDKDVVFLALNVGEESAQVKQFVQEQSWDHDVLIDPSEELAQAFRADALPQTVIIGKSGIIESVHVGFAGIEGLRKRLTDELEVLSVGGKIASAAANE